MKLALLTPWPIAGVLDSLFDREGFDRFYEGANCLVLLVFLVFVPSYQFGAREWHPGETRGPTQAIQAVQPIQPI